MSALIDKEIVLPYPKDAIKTIVVAGGIVKNNKLLVLFHNKFNKWSIPVGKQEVGESYTEALRREMMEEVDVKVLWAREVGIGEKFYPDRNILTTLVVFNIIDYIGTISNKEPDKHRHLRFMSVDLLKSGDVDITHVTSMYIEKLI